MAKLIDKLTDKQRAKIPDYVDRFLKIGLSTEPTDKIKAEAAVRLSYEYFHKLNNSCVAAPEFIWAESPMKGAILAAQHAKGDVNVTTPEVQEQANKASYGSFEAFWVSTYAFIAGELAVKKDELTDIAISIVTECGVYWNFEDLVIMTPKPTEIHMKDKRLHNEKGPALLYPNGDGVYAIDGSVKGSLMEVILAARVEQGTDTKLNEAS